MMKGHLEKDMKNKMAFRGMVFFLPLVSRECRNGKNRKLV